MRVLVIEDEPLLASAIEEALQANGYAVDTELEGESGLHAAVHVDYDAIVLDLMLPIVDGWTILKQVRIKKSTPIIVLTAKDGLEDKLRYLNAGADDYLTKPFELAELVARIRVLIRRSLGQVASTILLGKLKIDSVARW